MKSFLEKIKNNILNVLDIFSNVYMMLFLNSRKDTKMRITASVAIITFSIFTGTFVKAIIFLLLEELLNKFVITYEKYRRESHEEAYQSN